MNKIVIDLYGADAGPEIVLHGIAKALKNGLDFYPVVVGDAEFTEKCLTNSDINHATYEVLHTTEYIGAEESPAVIFGGNKDKSSMAMAYAYLKNNQDCIAMLSPGNTGALMVGSICRLGLAPNIKVPALASALPCAGDTLLCLVDCGANINCDAQQLAVFARMGNVFCKCFCNVAQPRVGLMSVGREKGKGTPVTQEAYRLIEQLNLNFVGNLEGSDMVSDYADVVVADGFTGNVLLKCTEAAGKAALSAIYALDIEKTLMEKIQTAVLQKFEFNARGAATLLGTQKTVVKMHGCANEDTVVASIDQILRLEKAGFSKRIEQEMSK